MSKKDHFTISKLSPELQDAIQHFLNCHPPKSFSRNLRSMLIEVITYQKGNQPLYMNSIMPALEMLFELLDIAQDEMENKSEE